MDRRTPSACRGRATVIQWVGARRRAYWQADLL